MPVSVAPTSLFPLGEEPTRVSVRINQDLFKLLDVSLDPPEEEDHFSRVGREARAALNQMTRGVSMAIFGANVAPLEIRFGWSKPVMGQDRVHHYLGVCFDHQVTKEVANPRVLELTAENEVDGVLVFYAEEVDTARRDQINSCISDARRGPGLPSGTAAS